MVNELLFLMWLVNKLSKFNLTWELLNDQIWLTCACVTCASSLYINSKNKYRIWIFTLYLPIVHVPIIMRQITVIFTLYLRKPIKTTQSIRWWNVSSDLGKTFKMEGYDKAGDNLYHVEEELLWSRSFETDEAIWTRWMTNPAFLQVSTSSSTCHSPSGQNATTAPPLPVNFDAAPTSRATSTIFRFISPRTSSPNIRLQNRNIWKLYYKAKLFLQGI